MTNGILAFKVGEKMSNTIKVLNNFYELRELINSLGDGG